jgi:UDP-N-acetylglucosamine--N-acetylmuramyl-(pentapeptide) pyrophosphoryl-undecaprenol N-acetylglucosamine transferase
VPAILIPFPQAADDHQTANAHDLAAAGAAELMPQTEATAELLAERVATLMSDEARLARMAQAARALARPDAHREIADVLETLPGT